MSNYTPIQALKPRQEYLTIHYPFLYRLQFPCSLVILGVTVHQVASLGFLYQSPRASRLLYMLMLQWFRLGCKSAPIQGGCPGSIPVPCFSWPCASVVKIASSTVQGLAGINSKQNCVNHTAIYKQ